MKMIAARSFSVAAAVVVLLWTGIGAAAAQEVSVATERKRISTERTKAQAAFSAELAACHQRFAVTQCVEDVRRRRRDVLADLRRQDTALSQEQRKRDAAEQVQRLDARQATQRDDEARRLESEAVGPRERDRRAGLRAQERQAEEARARSRARVQMGTPATPESERAVAQEAARARAAAQASDLALRDQAMQARREKREAATARNTKPPAKPLPVPP